MEAEALIALAHVAENLKNNTRHSWTSTGRHESVAEHSWRMAFLAWFLRDTFPEADIHRVILMCVFHDLGEAFTGDIPAFYKTAADEAAESRAIADFLATLPEADGAALTALFAEMEALETPEAKLYKALDKMETLIQHNEADIATWLPLEYEKNLTYGAAETEFAPYTRRLRAAINAMSREKMRAAGAPEGAVNEAEPTETDE